MPARLALVLIVAITTAGGAACSAERDNYEGGTIEVVLDETSASEVMLYVSNQSFEDSEVGIDVKIGVNRPGISGGSRVPWVSAGQLA